MKQVWLNNFTTRLSQRASSESTEIHLEKLPLLGIGEWCYLTLEANVGAEKRVEIITAKNTVNGYEFQRGKQGNSYDFPAFTIVECRVTADDLASLNSPFLAVHE